MGKSRRRRRRAGPLILLAFIAAVALIFADSWLRIVTDEYELGFEDLPEPFDGFRIVQLSDVHAREFGEGNARLVSAVAEAEPDIIVVTGDLIDAEGQGDIARTLLASLTELAPVYFVTGNHEWASGGLSELWGILDECGVTALRNSSVTLERGGESIVLAGAEDPGGPADMMTPEELISGIRQSEGEDSFIVLLYHRNDRLERYSQLGVDLVFCGHAHGGLVRLPFTDGLIDPKMDLFPTDTSGVYTRGGTAMVVSRGFGGPLRFLNNPHIPVAVLKTV